MNWVKENKFLTGYIAVMVICVGVLAFLVFSASGTYDDATTAYQKQATEYNRLRHLVPFPNKANLEKYEVQKGDAAQTITAFQTDLAKNEYPLESMSPSGFQDVLKAAVTETRQKAVEASVELPEKFFLGFEKYETQPPKPEAAGPLGRQLKAIKWVVDQYIENNVQRITGLVREELEEEREGGSGKGGGKPKAGGPPKLGGGPGGGGGVARQDLVHYHYFNITTICRQPKLQKLLNTISGPKAPQFYVIRQIRVRNEKDKGPSKATPSPDDKDKKASEFIAGNESIEAAITIDIVNFTAPEASSSAAAKTTPAEKKP